MMYDFFYGKQADQFSFFRIPKLIVLDPAFRSLSSDAKLLYGLLLDRMGLSMKNEWLDEDNRVYIIYQIVEIQKDLNISRRKAMDILAQLEKEGLVMKRKRNFGLPSYLYVKNFLIPLDEEVLFSAPGESGIQVENDLDFAEYDAEYETEKCSKEEKIEETALCDEEKSPMKEEKVRRENDSTVSVQSAEMDTLRDVEEPKNSGNKNYDIAALEQALLGVKSTDQKENKKETADIAEAVNAQETQEMQLQWLENHLSKGAETGTSEVQEQTPQRYGKQHRRGAETGTSEVQKMTPQRCRNRHFEGAETDTTEVQKSTPLINETEYNYNNRNHTYGNEHQSNQIVSERSDARRSEQELSDKLQAYRDIIEENISYQDLLRMYPNEKRRIESICDLIFETVISTNKTMRIAHTDYPSEVVKKRFMKLRLSHICYVRQCLEQNTSEIRNIKQYLLAVLFNAPTTIDGYYENAVNHHMAEEYAGNGTA